MIEAKSKIFDSCTPVFTEVTCTSASDAKNSFLKISEFSAMISSTHDTHSSDTNRDALHSLGIALFLSPPAKVISPNGNVGENAISVKTYRFQGNTEDKGSSATGVKQVEYKISESSTPETSGTTILASSGSWNFTQDFEEGKEGKNRQPCNKF